MEEIRLKALEAARDRACDALERSWSEMYKDMARAAIVYEEDCKPEGAFKFPVAVAIALHPMGGGDMEVSAKASWSVKKTVEPPCTTVSNHPDLFDKPKASE